MNKRFRQTKYRTRVELIYDYMKKHNLSKNKFAKLCGLSIYMLNNILRGNQNINYKHFCKVIKTINITFNDLFGL